MWLKVKGNYISCGEVFRFCFDNFWVIFGMFFIIDNWKCYGYLGFEESFFDIFEFKGIVFEFCYCWFGDWFVIIIYVRNYFYGDDNDVRERK